jgi:DNA-binding NtrC family response regulator
MSERAARILIVDDEPPLLKIMSAYLARLGYAIDTAASTRKAAALMESAAEPYDVVVIDASMPGMSMEDLGRQALHHWSSVRVIAASGYPVDMTVLEAAAPDRVMFLHKPFTAEMLANAVRGMIAGQKESL